MNDLKSRDVVLLLSTISELNADSPAGDISERVMRAVTRVVPNDLIAMDRFADSLPDDPAVHWNNNPEMLSSDIVDICGEVFENSPNDNPLVNELVQKKNPATLRLSDFPEMSTFRRSAYYNEIMRRVGFSRQMGVMLPVSRGVALSCAVHRTGRDFTDREVQLLASLAPHLGNAVRHADEIGRVAEARRGFEMALDAGRSGMAVVDSRGRVRELSGLARTWVAKYFGVDIRVGSAVPPQLFIGSSEASFSRSPSVLHARGVRSADSTSITLLFREVAEHGPDVFTALGLTPRQSEVLFWMAKGKTYSVIAKLIVASPRTVEKHVQLIFQKLGVESRTAAVSVAMERIGKITRRSES